MRITIVPSAVGGVDARIQYAISYIVNDTIAMDAGSLGLWRTPTDQKRIRHVLISHTHMDHVASLPLFLENTFEKGPDCPAVYGSRITLAGLQEDIFNQRLWPDFVALGRKESPFLRLIEVEEHRPVVLDGVKITPVPMDHAVPTLGYIFEDQTGVVAIASDTAPTEAIWNAIRDLANLKAVILEASFPNEMHELAHIARHLTPKLFAAELRKLNRPDVPVLVVHLKPKFYDVVAEQLAALQLPQMQIAMPGQTYHF